MRAAAEASAGAIAMCMRESFGGVEEHHLSCTFEHETRRRGAKRMAYPQVRHIVIGLKPWTLTL